MIQAPNGLGTIVANGEVAIQLDDCHLSGGVGMRHECDQPSQSASEAVATCARVGTTPRRPPTYVALSHKEGQPPILSSIWACEPHVRNP